MKKREKIDLIILLLWPIIATIFSLILKYNAMTSILIFLGFPALYLGIRGKEYVKKALLFSLVVGIPGMIIIDYIAHLTGDWLVPNSIFSFKIFGISPIEDIMWAVITLFFIIMFYEYFIDKHKTSKLWEPNFRYLVFLICGFFLVFLFLLFNTLLFQEIKYFYFSWGIILMLIPFLLQLFKRPKTTSKFFMVAAYFFYLHFNYEVTALKVGWWSFPGQFIGWVSVFGVNFPFEEFFFWFILLALAVLSYFEFFDDDEK